MPMRRGIAHIPLPQPAEILPLDPKRAQILGIPIEYHPNTTFPTADARGFFWRRRIVIGPAWMHLDARTQRAVLLHEARHLLHFHREQRVLLCALIALPSFFLVPWPILAAIGLTWTLFLIMEKLMQRHELDADAFAAEHGYGRDLLALIKKSGPPPKLPTFYPDYEHRCDALERRVKERGDAA